VNRCQTQIQNSLGTPAQATKLEDFQKDILSIDRRLEAVDRRIDLLHTVDVVFPFSISSSDFQTQVEPNQCANSAITSASPSNPNADTSSNTRTTRHYNGFGTATPTSSASCSSPRRNCPKRYHRNASQNCYLSSKSKIRAKSPCSI
jgi:hypothetical protein